jgi:hypothetical protein
MPAVTRSTVIEAPIEEVWAIIRDFNDWPSWHPNIASSEIEGDVPSGCIGCLRLLKGMANDSARERLIGLSDLDHSVHYTVEWASDLDMRNYVATIQLRRITDGDRTFAQWTGRFESAPELEDTLASGIATMIYEDGFMGIRERLPARQAA